ncbi:MULTISPECIES: cytochrome c nitrite reductase pentaheme subunit [Tenebrionibacter/Tenebrionicola group]|jgi:cytochrome c-type protein NrfB|uniref:Cytochrome c nitrite reductase pentaheme subunit n=2 Tax=Tenebrionibacter/Tenebrionicola group TaxID=2969848 RepID=A0A8K0V4D4_9ENTR|nr:MULTISPECIES: cytochrome c nitrite reductase pentaheme subunit [Tenebrionibacter/Tenebrionicola group]MBK4713890.1 cytochrome c nitrite reductase pentaheme subunit [Tenebrionibacter intestinalis]MBV4411499.1 cytochrome c nitrite reductase pentaheme subunit [Tenebrionicola larvae]MBV5096356.1 cytochrome c nitrite reductase pentaheme subunit [Tenebrionicola larvae]
MSVIRSFLAAGGLACSLWLALPAAAAAPSSEPSDIAAVALQRSRDSACLDCHKPHKDGMLGQHNKATNPNNGLPVTCTDCHGNPSPKHREGVRDVMRFNHADYSVAEQNGVCFACHQPEKLQKAFWPHDVHLAKVTCASCHRLHPEQDAVTGFNDKARIKLCVDCHSEQRNNPAFNPASVWPDKERP